eukprot:Nk52_evm24s1837 gene=Nk52_evmTU24s1837
MVYMTASSEIVGREILCDLGLGIGYGKHHFSGRPGRDDHFQARQFALEELKETAVRHGADAVVGLQFVSVDAKNKSYKMVLIAIGSMVVINHDNRNYNPDKVTSMTTRSALPRCVVTQDMGLATGYGKSHQSYRYGVLEAFEEAWKALLEDARKKGANAVIGVRCTDLDGGSNHYKRALIMTGEAVFVQKMIPVSNPNPMQQVPMSPPHATAGPSAPSLPPAYSK